MDIKIFLLVFLLTSCSCNSENRSSPKNPHLPESDKSSLMNNQGEVTTNKSINPLLCQDIDTIEILFDQSGYIDQYPGDNGGIKKKISFENGKWALFGSTNVNEDLISIIVTTTNEIKIHDFYRVGDTVSEILKRGDAFTFNEGEGGEYFYLLNENDRGYHLGFRVEKEFSSRFYDRVYSEGVEDATKNLDPNAKITELTIQVICEK